MNIYVKSFIHRGLIFSGLGPIVLGIVYAILSFTLDDFILNGTQVLIAIVSTYVLAFVQAGVSVFNQIEHWALPKSLFFHFSFLYITYVLCYIINSWIPFDITFLIVFTLIFISIYALIWIVTYFSIKTISKKFNNRLPE